MPAAMKRPAAKAAPIAKRVKLEDSTERKVDKAILAALAKRRVGSEAAPPLPSDVIQMLTAMLPEALGPVPTLAEPASTRHSFQESILEFVAKELKLVESDLIAQVAAQQQTVDGAGQERARRCEVEAEAAAAVDPKKAAVTAAYQYKESTAAAAAEAKVKFKEASDSFAAGNSAAEAVQKKLDNLKEALATKASLETPETSMQGTAAEPSAEPSVTEPSAAETVPEGPQSPSKPPRSPARTPGSPASLKKSPAKMQREATTFVKQLKSIVEDDNLLEAVKIAVGKRTQERGDFDTRILEQLQAELSKALDEQTKALQTLVDETESRKSALDQATVAKDAALETDTNAEMSASDADAALAEAEAALKSARVDVNALDAEIDIAKAKVAKAQGKLDEYRTTVLDAFESLRTPPVPQAEPAVQEEETAAASEAPIPAQSE